MSIFTGVVQKGTRRGAALGFPTANIPCDAPEASGIYAAVVTVDGKEYKAAAYADQKRKVLEAHILVQNLDLYGKEITVELLKKIRDGTTFENNATLRAAIASDLTDIRAFFRELL